LVSAKGKRLAGQAASPGFAVARALVLREPEPETRRRVPPHEVEREVARLRSALAAASDELTRSMQELTDLGEDEARDMVEFELLILQDPATSTAVEEEIHGGLPAEAALQAAAAPYTHRLANHANARFRDRAGEIESAFRAVLDQLVRRELPAFDLLADPVVVVARELAPHEMIAIDRHRGRVAGIATESGGRTSHFAILARTFGLPCVVGVADLSREVQSGEWIVVDAYSGTVSVRPSARALERHRRRAALLASHGARLLELRGEPCATSDGHAVELSANIELPAEVEHVCLSGAQGIGLYRTEFFYLDRPHLPSEEEQFAAYDAVARRLHPQPVIIRTMDLGGDKVASYLGLPKEANPFLGWRGIRFALHHPEMFRTQLRAIYRASVHGNLRMMFPMVTTYDELCEALSLCAGVRRELKRERHPFDARMPVGMMVETPSAVLSAGFMARRVAFFSIGSNDLIQYTLAMDRGNERIGHLYEPLEAAVLHSVRHTVREGHAAGIWVGVCGEMAGDPRIAVLLVGLGVDELSVSPFDVPRVKAAVRAVSYAAARDLAEKALALPSARDVRRLLRRELDPNLPPFLLGESLLGETAAPRGARSRVP
jgi:phosphotransferase system enzyme I (PtsI)